VLQYSSVHLINNVLILTGKPPFWNEAEAETYKKIVRGNLEFPPYLSEGAKDLVQKVD